MSYKIVISVEEEDSPNKVTGVYSGVEFDKGAAELQMDIAMFALSRTSKSSGFSSIAEYSGDTKRLHPLVSESPEEPS